MCLAVSWLPASAACWQFSNRYRTYSNRREWVYLMVRLVYWWWSADAASVNSAMLLSSLRLWVTDGASQCCHWCCRSTHVSEEWMIINLQSFNLYYARRQHKNIKTIKSYSKENCTLMIDVCLYRTHDWVQIIEPLSRDFIYINLETGECLWDPPKDTALYVESISTLNSL